MSELVLVIDRNELTKHGIGTDGIYPVDLNQLSTEGLGFLPRHIIDNKSEASIAVGKAFPQVLPYFIIRNEDNKFLTYYRKGKEKGLVGKRSLGVGGRIDSTDFDDINTFQSLHDIVTKSGARELREEIGLIIGKEHWDAKKFAAICTYADPTSTVHFGLTTEIVISPECGYDKLVFEPAEFLDVQWLTEEELVRAAKEDNNFETWSDLLIRKSELY